LRRIFPLFQRAGAVETEAEDRFSRLWSRHHWYFNGQTELNMALSAALSALEVVPLTLITLQAWNFVVADSAVVW
jgi:hypothetical protein